MIGIFYLLSPSTGEITGRKLGQNEIGFEQNIDPICPFPISVFPGRTYRLRCPILQPPAWRLSLGI